MEIGKSLKLECSNSLYINLTNKLGGELIYTNHVSRHSAWAEMAILSSDKVYQLRRFINRMMTWR
jgi:hypothetical protein